MTNKNQEVHNMTNKQAKALIEAIKIITEKSETLEEVKNALDRIQSVFEQDPK